ncbi:striatin-like isoform X1 [Limulus polyphemus]|uniref:Striatin-like isoform X1 n=2 Tax=Limulus polyphemus TaxID=6850 RepID=A0ABM1SYL3_LIMPO|nr:striatin-like isoform X1 [Limulus polyphemus]
MDDGPVTQNTSGQIGSLGTGVGIVAKTNQDEYNQRPHYSIPGILHFIQHEWGRFETERTQWEVERAELQARIAFLQGERKGQENLKNDLIRRIKMLEYALKQERAKFHKLKYGTELNVADFKGTVYDDLTKDEFVDGDLSNSNVSWKQGRQLLRQYLQEIGYTDTVIDVRSSRVRNLLGLAPHLTESDEKKNTSLVNGEQSLNRVTDTQRRGAGKKPTNSAAENALRETEASVLATFDFLASENIDIEDDEEENLRFAFDSDENGEERNMEDNKRIISQQKIIAKNNKTERMDDLMMEDAETEEVLSEFSFLGPESANGSREARSLGDIGEWEKSESDCEEEWGTSPQAISKMMEEFRRERNRKDTFQRPKRSALQAMLATLSNSSNEENRPSSVVPDNSPFTSSPSSMSQSQSGTGFSCDTPSGDSRFGEGLGLLANFDSLLGFGIPPEVNTNGVHGGNLTFGSGSRCPLLGSKCDDENMDTSLGLGELAGITVSNEAESCYDISASKEAFRKTWNAKYTLRSHFDGVRALAFHPEEPVLITASEDHTLKLWNLQKTVPAKKTASLDVEPIYTFRGHCGAVLCVTMSATGEQCFSGGLDSTIKCWNLPNSNIDPYDSYDPGVITSTLKGHSDAVWGLSVHSSKLHLLSCSADGTVRLWSPQVKASLLHTYYAEKDDGQPASVDFVRCDPAQMVAAYDSSNALIFDLETGKNVLRLDTINSSSVNPLSKQINRIVCHPTLPLVIAAYEDKNIRFFDITTGKMVHSMVAHLDAVTCLAIDPNGLYLLSGSHDCSIRLWNMDNKTCVQEITSHRKKFDESIYDVAFHPSKPYIASAGADALAKVFV